MTPASKLLPFIIIVFVGIALFMILPNTATGPTQTVTCTDEALMCPDGSAVGRSGPACEFAACGTQTQFTGTLAQSPDGAYYLHMKSVLPEAKEPYIMPLNVSTVNNSSSLSLVGKTVTIQGVFATGNTFTATAITESTINPIDQNVSTPTNTGRVMAPRDITLRPGQKGNGLGLTVLFNSVTSDSRCPADVQCIQAGNITTSLVLGTDDTSKTVSYSSDADPLRFEGYLISITDVQPQARSTKSIGKLDYSVTFHIESALTDTVDNPNSTQSAASLDCKLHNGTWDSVHRECTGIDEVSCKKIAGTWNECGSACRHNPKAEVCTQQCVQFCQL